MNPVRVFADARGFREEADRARKLASRTSGDLQDELHQIAVLYEEIADGNDPDRQPIIFRATTPKLKQLARFCSAWPDE